MNREIYNPVLQQLIQLSRFIMISAPACYLLPNSWERYREILEAISIDYKDDQMRICFESLSKRNTGLQIHSSHSRVHLRKRFSQRLIRLLDSLSSTSNYSRIAGDCLRVTNDSKILVSTCVEWSCSIYRCGLFRTYAATRLLRVWGRHGIELQQPLCDFLAWMSGREGLNRKRLYMLFAGLVSSKHFSAGRYLQWLMARGTLGSHGNCGPVSCFVSSPNTWLMQIGLSF